MLPETEQESETDAERLPRIAIVGRPNAGKSSLVNRLLGEERQIVDDRPGTTVDSVDTLYDKEGAPLVLIDTAGIRRKRAGRCGKLRIGDALRRSAVAGTSRERKPVRT